MSEPLRLREALDDVRTTLLRVVEDSESQHPGGWGPDVTTVADLRVCIATLDAARHERDAARTDLLVALDATADERDAARSDSGLDVTRLRRAMELAYQHDYAANPLLGAGYHPGEQSIAREYAALSPSTQRPR